MNITNGKVYYRTSTQFEAPATSVELVFVVDEGDDAEAIGVAALQAAKRIAISGLQSKAAEAGPTPAKPAKEPAKPRGKKAANTDPMADVTPAKEPAKQPAKADKTDPMADVNDPPRADTKGGVVPAEETDPDGLDAIDAAGAPMDANEFEAACRKEAGRLSGRVVKQAMIDTYNVMQMGKVPENKRREFLAQLAALKSE